MGYMVMVQAKPRSFWDDPPEGPWSGVVWESELEATEEAADPLRDPGVDLVWIKEVEQ